MIESKQGNEVSHKVNVPEEEIYKNVNIMRAMLQRESLSDIINFAKDLDTTSLSLFLQGRQEDMAFIEERLKGLPSYKFEDLCQEDVGGVVDAFGEQRLRSIVKERMPASVVWLEDIKKKRLSSSEAYDNRAAADTISEAKEQTRLLYCLLYCQKYLPSRAERAQLEEKGFSNMLRCYKMDAQGRFCFGITREEFNKEYERGKTIEPALAVAIKGGGYWKRWGNLSRLNRIVDARGDIMRKTGRLLLDFKSNDQALFIFHITNAPDSYRENEEFESAKQEYLQMEEKLKPVLGCLNLAIADLEHSYDNYFQYGKDLAPKDFQDSQAHAVDFAHSARENMTRALAEAQQEAELSDITQELETCQREMENLAALIKQTEVTDEETEDDRRARVEGHKTIFQDQIERVLATRNNLRKRLREKEEQVEAQMLEADMAYAEDLIKEIFKEKRIRK